MTRMCGNCSLLSHRDEGEVFERFKRVVAERQIMGFGERLRIEEVCCDLERAHIRHGTLLDDLIKDCAIFRIRRIDDIGRICNRDVFRDDVAGKQVERGAGCVLYILFDE